MQWFLRPGRRTRQSGRQRCAANDSFADKTNIIFAGLINAQTLTIQWLSNRSLAPFPANRKMNRESAAARQPDPRDDVSAPILPF
jgi:hypothetical protein